MKKLAETTQFWGQTLVGAGVAVTALGSGLRQLGLEEEAEVVEKIGSGLTTVGSILMGLPPILNVLKTALASVGKTGTAAGAQVGTAGLVAQSGWLPLLAITAALLAIFGIFAALLYTAKAGERRMKAMADATKDAKVAAEEAKQAYEELLDQHQEYENLKN
jgi:hypothetical protein